MDSPVEIFLGAELLAGDIVGVDETGDEANRGGLLSLVAHAVKGEAGRVGEADRVGEVGRAAEAGRAAEVERREIGVGCLYRGSYSE